MPIAFIARPPAPLQRNAAVHPAPLLLRLPAMPGSSIDRGLFQTPIAA